MQIGIIYFNLKIAPSEIKKKNISLENFSSIVFSKYGITSFGADKLNKIDEFNIFLEGSSYLENDFYKIYGKDIIINTKTEVSSSERAVEVINSMGTMNANGFKNLGAEGKIYFTGEAIFEMHE